MSLKMAITRYRGTRVKVHTVVKFLTACLSSWVRSLRHHCAHTTLTTHVNATGIQQGHMDDTTGCSSYPPTPTPRRAGRNSAETSEEYTQILSETLWEDRIGLNRRSGLRSFALEFVGKSICIYTEEHPGFLNQNGYDTNVKIDRQRFWIGLYLKDCQENIRLLKSHFSIHCVLYSTHRLPTNRCVVLWIFVAEINWIFPQICFTCFPPQETDHEYDSIIQHQFSVAVDCAVTAGTRLRSFLHTFDANGA